MKQFEIWLAPRRPVLLLTRNGAYSYLNRVAVADITTKARGLPVEVLLGLEEGLLSPCVANLDQIRTVPIDALTEKIGTLSKSRHRVVKHALGHAIEWDELPGL